MYLSDSTLEVLRNFSQINNGIVFKEGNILNTCSQSKTVLAKAVLEDYFPKQFGIFDMKTFLSVLTLGEDKPNIEINDDCVMINSESNKSVVMYRTTDESCITYPNIVEIPIDNCVAEFEIDEKTLKWCLQTSRILRSTFFRFVGDGTSIKMISSNETAEKSDSVHICDSDAVFDVKIDVNHFNIIMGSYLIKVVPDKLIYLKKKDQGLEYWMVVM